MYLKDYNGIGPTRCSHSKMCDSYIISGFNNNVISVLDTKKLPWTSSVYRQDRYCQNVNKNTFVVSLVLVNAEHSVISASA